MSIHSFNLIAFAALLALQPLAARAAESPSGTPPAAENTPSDDRVDVDAIKEKYWARGNSSELGVVQGRLHTKAEKLEFGVFGGLLATDPFLSVKNLGFSVGFHMNEFFSGHLLGWRSFTKPSSALELFEKTRGATTNTNEPKSFVGAEAEASLIYGKLSLLGMAILYYDFHLLGGAGITATETGNYFTPIAGLGQQIYVMKNLSLRVDYRLLPYKENIQEKVIPTKIGDVVDSRVNWSHAVTFGISYLIGKGADE